METKKLQLRVMDFSENPGPRYCNQGDDSGEEFYHTQLNKQFRDAMTSNSVLVLDLDGPNGYASSFLDEALGNLVYDFGAENVNKHMEIISIEEPEWISMLKNETIPQWEQRRIEQKCPKSTKKHNSTWYFDFNNQQIKIR